MRRYTLFTGLPRELDRWADSLRDCASFSADGLLDDVLLVTWSGALDESPDAQALVERHGVIVTEIRDVDDPGDGNLWRQMRCMQVGLDLMEPDDVVVKTRTDLYIDADLLRHRIEAASASDVTSPVQGVRAFTQRIWVPWFEITKPFYLADECMVGLARDLQAITHEDHRYDDESIDPGVGRAHIRRFIHPFRDIDPRVDAVLTFGSDDRLVKDDRFEVLADRLQDEMYLDVLGLYYAIVQTHFRIGAEPATDRIDFREWSDAKTSIDPGEFDANFAPSCSWRPDYGHVYCYDERWLDRLYAGEVTSSVVADAVRSSMQAAMTMPALEGTSIG
ncbi:MAG: hypothetical protein AAF432_09290 [Planctomycetota bacterium]